jgi:hypothetical protein
VQTETERPHFNRDGDDEIRERIGDEHLRLSPEEYAARYGHNWLLFNYDRYRYRDVALGAWVHRVAELLADQDELDSWRERLLTPDERAKIQQEMAEEW